MKFASKVEGLPIEDISALPMDKLKNLYDKATERLREIGFEYHQQQRLVMALEKAINSKREEYDDEGEGISEEIIE